MATDLAASKICGLANVYRAGSYTGENLLNNARLKRSVDSRRGNWERKQEHCSSETKHRRLITNRKNNTTNQILDKRTTAAAEEWDAFALKLCLLAL